MAILLCSANRSVLNRWKQFLAGKHGLAQATSLKELRNAPVREHFDMCLVHRSLVDKKTFSDIRKSASSSRFFLLSDRPNKDEGLAFLRLGIVGYANTYISPGRLEQCVRVISNGGIWLGRKVMQGLIRETYARTTEKASPDAARKLSGLTRRERVVTELVAQGQSSLEIAMNLNTTERKVKAHLASIYEKTGSPSRLNLSLMINQG